MFRRFRGTESERGRGETGGAGRGGPGVLIHARPRQGGERVEGSELARSLQREEEDDPGIFANRPLAIFLFVQVLFLF